jgi:hypothetical protein
MTPSTKPVTRITSAYIRDRGLRPVVVTVTGSLIELRAKGLRSVETIDVASAYYAAVKARVLADKRTRAAERQAKRKGRAGGNVVPLRERRA